jgi:hypothetical protein
MGTLAYISLVLFCLGAAGLFLVMYLIAPKGTEYE